MQFFLLPDPHGSSPHGPHITYQYIDQATFTNGGTNKLDEKIQKVDERLTRLIALFILQKKVGTSSVRPSDDFKKQGESLERVNDGLTKVLGLLQNIAGSSSSMKNDEVKKLIKDSLQNKAGMPWIPYKEKVASSCKEIYSKNRFLANDAYLLQTECGYVPIYCHMTKSGMGACGGGGWTLVMKIDGQKRTFHYDSKFWGNKENYNLEGGMTGFDRQETKLPTYWNTPFSKICLGMKIGLQPVRFSVMNVHANSLHSLIASGGYHNTSYGPENWKTLIGSEASLQTDCYREGFNVIPDSSYSKARIGIVGAQGNTCRWYRSSRIGFGTGGRPDDSSSCGNEDSRGGKHLKAMGYIFVQ
ncbi:uncharacterized protein LOC111330700 isoform X2 [Stylophora pistillata]|uniref:uncharacterized protein LOC111330700 isoform X2 n=1 Tax=Stylophora pistillata TaxID=50429 RepID=UPI000C0540A0|nr:uncharacterized protein LOC111330700 isoform X2 [Stylophora pistillata]